MLDDLGKHRWIGAFRRNDPRSPCAVQADGHTVLAGDRSELGDRGPRAAGDRQAEAGVGEQRPPGGMGGGLDRAARRPPAAPMPRAPARRSSA